MRTRLLASGSGLVGNLVWVVKLEPSFVDSGYCPLGVGPGLTRDYVPARSYVALSEPFLWFSRFP